jgi:hypothetical protein
MWMLSKKGFLTRTIVLKDNIHISLQILKITVMPKMYEDYDIPTVLALPLLWACQEPSLTHMIHQQVLSRVQQGDNSIRGQHTITFTLVYKVPLHILRLENLVFIKDAVAMGEDEGEAIDGSQVVTTATYSSPARSKSSSWKST